MAGHYAGSTNSFSDLKAAVESALSLEGWTEVSGIFNKGGLFVQFQVVGAAGGQGLSLIAGTGQSAGVLTGAAPNLVQIHSWSSVDPIFWPANYEIHVGDGPTEVYVVLNYNVDRIQTLAFGISPAPGNPTGYWISGAGGPGINFASPSAHYYFARDVSADGNSAPYSDNPVRVGAGVLASRLGANDTYRSYRYHDGVEWRPTVPNRASPSDGLSCGASYAYSLMRTLPSEMNQGMVLIPAYLFEFAPDNRTLPILQLGHLRHCRIDNYRLGNIVEFGPDKWKVYPIGRKSTENPTPGTAVGESVEHTGCFGMAIRYHGS